MSRRHHHHNIQPYDYERFKEHRERDQARGIEYQDDSLSSINSEDESYLHHPRLSKDKKMNVFQAKSEASTKPTKQEKAPEAEAKKQPSNSDSASIIERMGRVETMIEELMKRMSPPKPQQPEPSTKERNDGKFCLEPRSHDFTTSMWINKIQEISVQNNWSEKSTIQYMGTQMSGIVKAWYNSLPNYDYTWPEWKILITKIFPDNTDFITTLKRLVTRLKQTDESVSTYYFSKMYLIEACKITGQDAVSCLIDGLNNQAIQDEAKAQNFVTPETLYSQFLMNLPDYSVDYLPSAPPSDNSVLNNWYYNPDDSTVEAEPIHEGLIKYEPDEKEEFNFTNQSGSEFHDEVLSQKKRPGTIHSRLGVDKRFVRTNQFRQHNKVPLAARVCTICEKRGHLARNCRNGKKVLHTTLIGTTPKKCFYKECTVNGRPISGFVDTGCTTVAIQATVAKELDLKINSSASHVEVYGGGLVRVVGETDFELGVDSVIARVRAVVVPDGAQEMPVLIGQEFLNQQKNVSMFLNNETLKIFRAPSTTLH